MLGLAGEKLQGAITVEPLDRELSQEREEINWACGDCIGQGAFGKVMLGLNVITGTLMAVKQVKTPFPFLFWKQHPLDMYIWGCAKR